MRSDALGSVLYYPNFRPDVNWLKCSLLYWDSVHRIVPMEAEWDVRKGDSAEIREAERSGVLRPLEPTDYRDGAGVAFEERMLPLMDGRTKEHKAWVAEVKSVYSYNLHPGKVVNWLRREAPPNRIRDRLTEIGFLADRGQQVNMPGAVAGFYMTCLAAEIGDKAKMDLMTDEVLMSPAVENIMFSDPLGTAMEQERAVLGRVGIRFPKPSDMATIPLKTLLKFHEKRVDDRMHFRFVLKQLLEKLSTATDKHHINAIIEEEARSVKAAMLTRRRLFSELGLPAMWSFLKVTIPTWLMLPKVQEWFQPEASGLAPVAIGFAATIEGVRKDYAKLKGEHPWHYGWDVAKSFGPPRRF